MNHLMLHKLGIKSFYGQAFLPDICELEEEMLPYSEKYFLELLQSGSIRSLEPSPIWYEERTDFGPKAIGTKRVSHENEGFLLLQGSPVFQGEILGGCIDTLYDIFDTTRHEDSVSLCKKYALFPDLEDWKGKILLLESSENQPNPEKYRKMLKALKKSGIFEVLSGVLVGKPMDERYSKEYQEILPEAIGNPTLPIVFNLNVGHATPRAILPLGIMAKVDVSAQRISFSEA